MAIAKTIPGSPDPIRLGGAGRVLGAGLEAQIESEVRTTILGHVQRGGSPTPFDRVLSTRFGTYVGDPLVRAAPNVGTSFGTPSLSPDLERMN